MTNTNICIKIRCKEIHLTQKDGEEMKDLSVSLLLDFYGNLLSEKHLLMMEQYYQEDLSLSEIASITGMTRQGVHDNIKRAAGELKQYEEKLGLISRFSDITKAADKINSLIIPDKVIDKKTYDGITELLDIIKNEA